MLHLTDKELQKLSDRWLSGTINDDDREKLEQWYNQESPQIIDWDSDDEDEHSLKERLFLNIKYAQNEQPAFIRFLNTSHTRKVAATLLFLLGFGVFYWLLPAKTNLIAQNSKPHIENKNINKAILTLADGSKVILDNAQNGVVANQGNIQVDKTNNGKLTYRANDSPAAAAVATQYNSVSTPVGSQYQVSLSDGSKVWLNALSTIKYPTAFTGNERVVQLTGEAYFEVEKNKKMPFKVILANNTSVEVLGTHFNVMAYNDEKNIDATLLEGSIKVQKGDINKTIVPGEQAKITDDITVSTVNAEEAIAWKNGLFSFDKSDTQNIMRQIGRWYGVDVVYQGKVPDNQITGYIARTSNLTEVLKMLEISGVKSIVKNNKITIIN